MGPFLLYIIDKGVAYG